MSAELASEGSNIIAEETKEYVELLLSSGMSMDEATRAAVLRAQGGIHQQPVNVANLDIDGRQEEWE